MFYCECVYRITADRVQITELCNIFLFLKKKQSANEKFALCFENRY